ncbi:MAG: MopE-related protein [Pseudomonadota bacterium]
MRLFLLALFALGCGEKLPVDTGPGADQDADGYVGAEDGGADCDDADAAIHPGADEVCDGADNDCDGAVDEGDALDAPTWYDDGDGDGFGDPEVTAVVCDAPAGFIADSSDCDDDEDLTFPGADERCDGADNDCDGVVDEDTVDPPTWFADADGDGYGDATVTEVACPAPSGFVARDGTSATDCDDGDAEVHPGADELCDDGVDSDCDGLSTPCTMSLAQADLTLTSGVVDDELGMALAAAGDVDGDGHQDLILGAPADWVPPGSAVLLYGPFTGRGVLDVDTLPGARLLGGADQSVGYVVGGGGDLDGDGVDDLVLSSRRDATDVGTVWIVTSAPEGQMDLALASTVLSGENDADLAGSSVAVASDLDGDGHTDLVVGVPGVDAHVAEAGAFYLFRGPIAPGSATMAAADAALLGNSTPGGFGHHLAPVGDVDGDGLDDLLTSAFGVEHYAGAVYLHLGPVSGIGSVADADLAWSGEAESDCAGADLEGAGDVNGDGYADLLVGASGVDVGAVYLILGPGTSGSLADADLKIVGQVEESRLGSSLAGGLDLDGDGQLDFLAGASGEGPSREGVVYLFSGGLTGTASTADAQARLVGTGPEGYTGVSLAVVSDLGGPGTPGVVIGAPWAGADGGHVGEAYVLLDWAP